MRQSSLALVACALLAGCTRVTAKGAADTFAVPVATAILLTRGSASPRWCTAFPHTTLAIGDTVTLVWPDEQEGAPTLRTLVRRVRRGQCPPAFSLMGDTLGSDVQRPADSPVELAPADSAGGRSEEYFPIAIAIANGVQWVRGPDHLVRADLDGDGQLELVRSCASQEGLHLTLWTVTRPRVAPDSGETPRWHSYFPLGYDVEPNCTARETNF
ncbi:MAG: hypothetical protein M3Z10_14745 [Gemmatimonadota bacterium]|nr:hypothetical protein [Gemmatimonadota bacterium]